MLDSWFAPLRRDRTIRRDVAAFLKAVDKEILVDVADRLGSFDRPGLIIWAAEDRVMPPGHAERLAACLPDAKVIKIPDSYTLIQLDRPDWLAERLGEFAA